MSRVHALIDGDWILYAAGFAGQKQALVCPSRFGSKEFTNITELKQACIEDIDGELEQDLDPVYKRDILDPESHFYHSAKRMIETQLGKITEKFGVDAIDVTVLIDGDGNFRTRLATMKPYKGNRAANSKPLFYNNLRQYLLDVWAAEVVHGHETDDEMTIRSTKLAVQGDIPVIVGVDKDYMQQPGWILNPSKGFKKIGAQEGQWRLYVQCLTGDSADNIPGAYKVGPAKAKSLIGRDWSEQEMWNAVVQGFRDSMDKHPDAYPAGLTPEDAALENMRLVYLRRQPDEMWTPPTGDRDE